jgi:hypothetical protein
MDVSVEGIESIALNGLMVSYLFGVKSCTTDNKFQVISKPRHIFHKSK